MSRARIVVNYIKELERRFQRNLTIVETGTIRNVSKEYESGDGHSTLYISQAVRNSEFSHTFYSIDLHIKIAGKYLMYKGLSHYVHFLQGNSLKMLQTIPKIDIAYLDTVNNADYILAEFKIVEDRMQKGVIIVDDVDMASTELVKGHKVVPYARELGLEVKLLSRQAVILKGI